MWRDTIQTIWSPPPTAPAKKEVPAPVKEVPETHPEREAGSQDGGTPDEKAQKPAQTTQTAKTTPPPKKEATKSPK